MGRIAHKVYRSKSGGRIMPQITTFNQPTHNLIKRVNEPPLTPQADPNTPQNLNIKQRY